MGTKDPRIDAYIKKSADFAKPILNHLRFVVHEACPRVQETMKWSFPHFEYEGVLCSMASFKEHCAFGFWKGSLVLGEESPSPKRKRGNGDASPESAMGQFGRITSLDDLPSKKTLIGYIKKAMKLNEEGVKTEKPKRQPKELVEPAYFLAALKRNKKALGAYQKFSLSHKREYVEWITEAKQEATRERRLEQALEWMAEGKSRNWRYEKR